MTEGEKIKTQLVIVTGFIFLYLVFKFPIFIYAAALLGVVFLFIPKLGHLVVQYWINFAQLLGSINSKILLSIVYVLFLVPISCLHRFFVKNPLDLKQSDTNSLFKDRNHTYIAQDLENIW